MYFLFCCFTGLAYIDVKHLKFLKFVATLKYISCSLLANLAAA